MAALVTMALAAASAARRAARLPVGASVAAAYRDARARGAAAASSAAWSIARRLRPAAPAIAQPTLVAMPAHVTVGPGKGGGAEYGYGWRRPRRLSLRCTNRLATAPVASSLLLYLSAVSDRRRKERRLRREAPAASPGAGDDDWCVAPHVGSTRRPCTPLPPRWCACACGGAWGRPPHSQRQRHRRWWRRAGRRVTRPAFGGKGTAGGNGGRGGGLTGLPPAAKARLVAVEGGTAVRLACLQR